MKYILILFLLYSSIIYTQENKVLPYQEISDYPEEYAPGSILSRMIDGIGFRYYWATEGLTSEDLKYKPSADGRTTLETMQHIYDLSVMILNVPQGLPNTGVEDGAILDYDQLRNQTLNNLKKASELFANKSATDLEQQNIIFTRGDYRKELPLWNLINGPLADCQYHIGQIVAFRRASGNPINPNLSLLLGKVME